MPLRDISWEAFQALDLEQKAPYLMAGGRPSHVLIAQQFDRGALDGLGSLTTQIRRIAKDRAGAAFLSGLLSDKRAMLFFTQPSSRTFLSHLAACQILGMQTGEVRDPTTSSEVKGESRDDSVRTFSSYFDLIIMRSKERGLAERTAWVLSNSERPIPVINAGSGPDQHPTQALLDIYTLQRSFESDGGMQNKRIVFVGDLARGRTVRSLAVLLAEYEGVHLVFSAPEAYQISDDILNILNARGVSYEVTGDFYGAIPDADAIYMTRVQDEWDSDDENSVKVDISAYGLRVEDLERMKSSAVIMHPLPRRGEIPAEIDNDPRAKYWRQMRNGMWVRAALIAQIFGCEDSIRNYANGEGAA
jgi:aspartate carbamoyltransferase catalytic subunit